jgi:hypothetical protein
MDARMAAPATCTEPAQLIPARAAVVHQDANRRSASRTAAPVTQERGFSQSGELLAAETELAVTGPATAAREDRGRPATAE